MPKLSKEKELEKEQQIATGYLTCKTCLENRELSLFYRQIKDDKFYYKNKRCKICLTGREPKPNKNTLLGYIKKPKTFTLKKNIRLSPDVKEFIKRVIMMKGYVDNVEAFKLAHYHIETFGPIERLITNTELELTTMFKELLEVYYKCDTHRVKL